MTHPVDLFYPIVPDAIWVQRLVPLGVKTIQLRIKDLPPGDRIRHEIATALKVTDQHGATLIVNDYWQEAIQAGARFVHLGQDDLRIADRRAIADADMKLGISTHDESELETALTAKPDYVALGPIYETTLKVMRWAPQGLARLGAWKARIGPLPLVAIGGFTPERATLAIEAGAQSVAVVTDVLKAPDPEARTQTWLTWVQTMQRKGPSAI